MSKNYNFLKKADKGLVGSKLKYAKVIIGVGVIAVVVLGIFFYQSTLPVDVTTQKVEKGPATLSFTEVGDVTAARTSSVHSVATGKVVSVSVQEGQSIKAGDAICEIDPLEGEGNKVITAPIAGVITSLPVKDTDVVDPEMEIATIASEENKKIEVMVNTTDIDSISLDTSVELILRRREGDKTLTGSISAIDNKAEVVISAKGNKEHLVKVTIQPDQTELLEIGYDIDVQFNFYDEENQLKVPKSAIFEEDDKDFVWVVVDDALEKREIEIKKTLRSEIVVEKGISQGETVVVDALATGLQEGKAVK